MKTKILLLLSFLMITTASFSQTRTLNQKLRMKKTPNLSTPDSIVTKDSNQILRTTSIDDLKTAIGLGGYLENVVEDTTPELGGNLEMNGKNIIGGGAEQIIMSGNISGNEINSTWDINSGRDLNVVANVKLDQYPNTRNDGGGVNYLYTDIAGNVQSSLATGLGATKTSQLENDGDGVSPYQTEKRKQTEIVASHTLIPSDNGKTIWINSATDITVTVDNTLPENFECYFYNINTGTATFTAGTGTIDTPDGTILIEDKVCVLIKKEDTNDYKIKGQLE